MLQLAAALRFVSRGCISSPPAASISGSGTRKGVEVQVFSTALISSICAGFCNLRRPVCLLVNHRELFEHAFLNGALDGFRARVVARRRGERLVSERCRDEVAGGAGADGECRVSAAQPM